MDHQFRTMVKPTALLLLQPIWVVHRGCCAAGQYQPQQRIGLGEESPRWCSSVLELGRRQLDRAYYSWSEEYNDRAVVLGAVKG